METPQVVILVGFHTGIDFPKSQMNSYSIYSVCTGTVVKNITGVTGRSPALGNECDVQRDGDGYVFYYSPSTY